MVRGDPGPVVGRGVEEGPAGGVVTEGGGVLRGGHGAEIDGFGVMDLDAAALRGDDPYEGVGEDLGTGVVGDAERDDVLGEVVVASVCVPVPAALLEDLGHERPGDFLGGFSIEADVQKSGSGDRDLSDTGRAPEVRPQDLGNLPRRPPGRTRQLQRDVRGVVPTSAGPGRGHHGPFRHRHAQFPLIHGTTHRAQHGTGELDGGHGTSLGEEGVGRRVGLGVGPGCGRGWEADSGRGRLVGEVGDRAATLVVVRAGVGRWGVSSGS